MSRKRLLEFCKAWGVNVVHCERTSNLPNSHYTRDGHQLLVTSGPEVGGISFVNEYKRSTATIYFPIKGRWYRSYGWALLHELNHVIHAELNGMSPRDHDEIGSSMLAFEWYAGRWLGLRHKRHWWGDYCIEDPKGAGHLIYWENTPAKHRRKLLKASFPQAVEAKLLLPTGEPCIDFKDPTRGGVR